VNIVRMDATVGGLRDYQERLWLVLRSEWSRSRISSWARELGKAIGCIHECSAHSYSNEICSRGLPL